MPLGLCTRFSRRQSESHSEETGVKCEGKETDGWQPSAKRRNLLPLQEEPSLVEVCVWVCVCVCVCEPHRWQVSLLWAAVPM